MLYDAGQMLSYPDKYLALDVCLLLLMAAFEILRVYWGKIELPKLLEMINTSFVLIYLIHAWMVIYDYFFLFCIVFMYG